jgi:hypothetical protein
MLVVNVTAHDAGTTDQHSTLVLLSFEMGNMGGIVAPTIEME